MQKILIISSSVRLGRNSHRVALFFNDYIARSKDCVIEILDLNTCQFPIFDERLRYTKSPTNDVIQAVEKVTAADGVIIVTPEYNGGYPASLKNFIDLLYDEWKRKPIAIATVSNGNFGGAQVTTSLVFSLWKIGAWVIPAMYPVPGVQEAYDENGAPFNKEATDARAKKFIDELFWCIEAKKRMEALS